MLTSGASNSSIDAKTQLAMYKAGPDSTTRLSLNKRKPRGSDPGLCAATKGLLGHRSHIKRSGIILYAGETVAHYDSSSYRKTEGVFRRDVNVDGVCPHGTPRPVHGLGLFIKDCVPYA